MGQTLRVLSANLWNGAADPDAFAELVASLAADIVAVQEVSPDQAEALSAVMPYGRITPSTDYTGMGLLSKAPCEMDCLELPVRDAPIARFAGNGENGNAGPLEVVNVHVSAPHVTPLGSSIGLRRRQAQILDGFLRTPATGMRLMLGDFNSTPVWPFYRGVVRYMRDAAIEVAEARGRRPLATWGPTPEAPRMLRIDHAFVTGVDVKDFHVVPVQNSDHSAIVVDLELS